MNPDVPDQSIEQLVPVFSTFFFIIIILGAGTAYLGGRAVAATWRPWWQLLFYMPLQGAAVYFLHFTLFSEALTTVELNLIFYAVDTLACIVFGLLGFRLTRVHQMITQYRWLNQRRGAMSWSERGAQVTKAGKSR